VLALINLKKGSGKMVRFCSLFFVALFSIILSAELSKAETYGGVEFPDGELSFADAVIDYMPGFGVSSPWNNPNVALGIPDAPSGGDKAVSLGDGGGLILQFTDNSLTTSGDSSKDLWIFEVGPATEPTKISISKNGIDWIAVGETSGATSGIDIDSYIGSGVYAGEKYSFVKLISISAYTGDLGYRGADIDAVGAISSDEMITLIANAGTDQIVFDEITLDGTNSYDLNDNIASYQWKITHRNITDYEKNMEGSIVTINSLEAGFYDVILTIINNEGGQSSDTMFFSATGINCDVNDDSKTGLEEAIHALQIVAGIK
jgi:hypothetical protein